MDDLNGTAPVIESGRFRFLFLSFLRMFIFVGRGSAFCCCLFEIFSVIFFIPAPKVYFGWARGAGSREQPKEERGMAR